MEMNYLALVDGTNFGTVKGNLLNPHSPLSGVLFVAFEDLLPAVAAILDPGSERSLELRRRQLDYLLRSGQVRPGVSGEAGGHGLGVNTDAIARDAFCRVLYLPPLYLVHVPGLDLARAAGPDPSPVHGGC